MEIIGGSFDEGNTHQQYQIDRSKEEEQNLKLKEKVKLQNAHSEMQRIIDEILLPEFNNVANLAAKSSRYWEIKSLESLSTLTMKKCRMGVLFLFGNSKQAQGISFTAMPEQMEFRLAIRKKDGKRSSCSIPYAAIIPRNIREFFECYFSSQNPRLKYKANYESYEKYDFNLMRMKTPFRIQTEKKGKFTEVTSAEGFGEAVKMASTILRSLRGESLVITDAKGKVCC